MTGRSTNGNDIPPTVMLDSSLQSSSYVLDETYSLEVIEGPHEGLVVPLQKEVTLIGRQPFVGVPLFKDRLVSARHCEIKLEEEGVRVRDLHSSNGIFLGDCRVFDAYMTTSQPLKMGGSVLRLRSKTGSQEVTVQCQDGSGQLVGKSDVMKRLFALLERLGSIEVPVLLLGETGVGKTSVARAIHEQSERSHGPFVEVNCAAIPENLIEAQLFGYVKGAFTGAVSDAKGFFEQADGGTLFLDEVAELPVNLQTKLLSAIEEKRIRPLGKERDVNVNFRLICATNHELSQSIKDKTFREDLYYRIAVGEIELPPLRDRREDMPLLVEHLFKQMGHDAVTLTSAAMERLQLHHWPGNIRELRNTLERAQLLNLGDELGPEQIRFQRHHDSVSVLEPISKQNDAPAAPVASLTPDTTFSQFLAQFPLLSQEPPLTLRDMSEQVERAALLQALSESDNNVSAAARQLGIKRSWIYSLLKKHDITPGKDS